MKSYNVPNYPLERFKSTLSYKIWLLNDLIDVLNFDIVNLIKNRWMIIGLRKPFCFPSEELLEVKKHTLEVSSYYTDKPYSFSEWISEEGIAFRKTKIPSYIPDGNVLGEQNEIYMLISKNKIITVYGHYRGRNNTQCWQLQLDYSGIKILRASSKKYQVVSSVRGNVNTGCYDAIIEDPVFTADLF